MPAIKQDANVSLVLSVGVISGILIIVTIIGVQAWYQSEEDAEASAKADEYPNQTLIDLKAGQTQRISDYRWVDQKNNVVAIPIDKAMDVFVQTQGQLPATQPSQP